MEHLDTIDTALLQILQRLKQAGFNFVTPTPASHARVIARPGKHLARSLVDIFGWNLPFSPGDLPCDLHDLLVQADMLDEQGPWQRSRLRISAVQDHLYLHSAYPTQGVDAVFLGPDSHRFANLIVAELAAPAPQGISPRIVDIGTGAGVGAIVAAGCRPAAEIIATDINAQALRFTRINAAAAGIAIETVDTPGLAGVAGEFDVILLDPPYLIDDDQRAYRHGGGMHGAQLSVDLTKEGLARLRPGGRLILYTGSAIIDGRDPLRAALTAEAREDEMTLRYREIDPDIFGEELDKPQYADVDRIALISAIFDRA